MNRTSSSQRRQSVKQNIRQLVWNTHVGSKYGSGLCSCCGSTQITPFNFECGHIVARAKGGKDSVHNLRPICGLCNRSMGTMNMFEFQRLHQLPLYKSYPLYQNHRYIISIFILIIVALAFFLLKGGRLSP